MIKQKPTRLWRVPERHHPSLPMLYESKVLRYLRTLPYFIMLKYNQNEMRSVTIRLTTEERMEILGRMKIYEKLSI